MSTNATFGNASHLLTLAGQKGITLEACDALVQTGLQADLFEAAVAGKLPSLSRDAFRQALGLPPLSCLRFLRTCQLGPTAAKFSLFQLERAATFMEMVSSLLGKEVSEVEEASRLLIAGGHCFTDAEVDAFIKLQEAGDDIGLNTNGYANFLPVINQDGKTVSMAYVDRGGRGWDADRYPLDNGYRWIAGYRFASRNSGTLGPR